MVSKKIWRPNDEDCEAMQQTGHWGSGVVTRGEFMEAFRHAQEAVAKPLHEICQKMDRIIEQTGRHDERLDSQTAALERGEARMTRIERAIADTATERHQCQRELARRHTQQDEMRQEVDDLADRVVSLEIVRHQAGGWLKGWDWLKGAGLFGAIWAAWELVNKGGK